MGRASLRMPTSVETFFLAVAAAAGWFSVVPTVAAARDAARVDLAARSLADCDRAVGHLCRIGAVRDASEVTLEMVVADRSAAGAPVPVWPAAADVSSFDPAGPGGCSIAVSLSGGRTALVTAASNSVDHAN